MVERSKREDSGRDGNRMPTKCMSALCGVAEVRSSKPGIVSPPSALGRYLFADLRQSLCIYAAF